MSCRNSQDTAQNDCTRARLLAREAVIDLDEWASSHGHPAPFPVTSGITAGLWQRIERLPFRLAGKVSIEERVLDVVARARTCVQQRLSWDVAARLPEGLTLHFAAALPSSAGEHDRQPLELRCGPCPACAAAAARGLARGGPDCALLLTIGMAFELDGLEVAGPPPEAGEPLRSGSGAEDSAEQRGALQTARSRRASGSPPGGGPPSSTRRIGDRP